MLLLPIIRDTSPHPVAAFVRTCPTHSSRRKLALQESRPVRSGGDLDVSSTVSVSSSNAEGSVRDHDTDPHTASDSVQEEVFDIRLKILDGESPSVGTNHLADPYHTSPIGTNGDGVSGILPVPTTGSRGADSAPAGAEDPQNSTHPTAGLPSASPPQWADLKRWTGTAGLQAIAFNVTNALSTALPTLGFLQGPAAPSTAKVVNIRGACEGLQGRVDGAEESRPEGGAISVSSGHEETGTVATSHGPAPHFTDGQREGATVEDGDQVRRGRQVGGGRTGNPFAEDDTEGQVASEVVPSSAALQFISPNRDAAASASYNHSQGSAVVKPKRSDKIAAKLASLRK